MSVTAQFSATPKIGMARITGTGAANTARDGSGTEATNIFNVFSAGASGSRIDKVHVTACGTLAANTAGMLRLFISDGTNKRLYREITLAATTPSASAVGVNNFSSAAIDLGLILPDGHSLWATSHFADAAGNQFDVIASGGDF